MREVSVDGFWIDRHPVTVAEFRRFVKATGRVTWAEQAPKAADYPDADPELLMPGSLVFGKTPGPVDLTDYTNWWAWTPGADWRHPEGPDSNVGGRERHPVTHVSTRMQLRMPNGSASRFQPRRSGSTRRAAASSRPFSPGGTSSRRRAG